MHGKFPRGQRVDPESANCNCRRFFLILEGGGGGLMFDGYSNHVLQCWCLVRNFYI